MKYFWLLALISMSALAYVPTVESLFRNGSNPEVTSNAIIVSAKISNYNPFEEKTEETTAKDIWVKWVYNITPQNKLKITQLIYSSASMNEASLVAKTYVSELVPQYFGSNPTMIEKGLFISTLNSLLINDGSFMVEYLKMRGVDVRSNNELINLEKKSLLQKYKAWLIKTKGGRESEGSPLTSDIPAEREKIESILKSPMYLDTKNVILARHQGEPAWQVKAEGFEAWVNDEKREIKQVTMKNGPQEIDLQMSDYILFNGTNYMPRNILFKNAADQLWRIEVLGIRPFNESVSELLGRLRRYDQLLQFKQELVTRPTFML